MKLRSLLVTLALTVGATVPATISAPAAEAASACTTVWLTTPAVHPHNFQPVPHVLAGSKRCLWPDDRTTAGWIKVYQFDDNTRPVIGLAYTYTTQRPNSGKVKSTADVIRMVAEREGVRVQFSARDGLGRLGCSGGFINHVTGTYQPQVIDTASGQGLIRIGTGTTDRCMHDKWMAVNTFKFEAARAIIERKCGTTGPPRAGNTYLEIAAVTAAYSLKYLRASLNDGGVEPTADDTQRATQIHNGNCG